MNLRAGFFIVILLGLLGCAATNTTTFKSNNASSENVDRPKRLLIYTNMKSGFFKEQRDKAFQRAVTSTLESCGVTARFVEYNPVELDTGSELRHTISEFKPDAVIAIRKDGGDLSTGSGGTSGTLNFIAQMTRANDSKVVWKAQLSNFMLTNNIFVNEDMAGEKFGRAFVGQIYRDRIISECPESIAEAK